MEWTLFFIGFSLGGLVGVFAMLAYPREIWLDPSKGCWRSRCDHCGGCTHDQWGSPCRDCDGSGQVFIRWATTHEMEGTVK